jgi:hypothetical protein
MDSINICGSFLIVAITFFFKKLYADQFNYMFIVWFIVSFMFWSADSTELFPDSLLQFTPAVYFLAIPEKE